MKTKTYLKMFKDDTTALNFVRSNNRAFRAAGNRRDLYVVAPGPNNDFAVMDLRSAIELGLGYKWEC